MKWKPEERLVAMSAAHLWTGTPHRNRVEELGIGIDCIRFVIMIWAAAGVIEKQQLPSYPIAWGLGAKENKIAAALALAFHVDRIDPEQWTPEFGDVVIFKVGRQSNHCGIILENRLWHVAVGVPVGHDDIERIRPALQEIVRLKRRGWRTPPESINLREV